MPKFAINRTYFFNSLIIGALIALAYFFSTQQTSSWPTLKHISQHLPAQLSVLSWLALCVWVGWQQIQKKQQEKKRAQQFLKGQGSPWLIAYASQTGYAENYALQTAQALQQAGKPVQLLPLAQVTSQQLSQCSQALFLVSTTGDGDAPDNSLTFVRQVMSQPHNLNALRYGLLALGDRSYAQYCAFGHRLQHWLQQQQAIPLFDTIEVDNGNEGAIRHWQHQLAQLTGNTQLADWQSPHYNHWQLVHRECLNPHSQGFPVYHIGLQAPREHMQWQAGDIAEIGPCNSPSAVQQFLEKIALPANTLVESEGQQQTLQQALARYQLPQENNALQALNTQSAQQLLQQLTLLPHREYSIASTPAEGQLQLLLRQVRGPDGRLGLGSAWLTEHAPLHGSIALRIRQNRNFHAPPAGTPLILIGNGTGIAGLRAHLKAREENGEKRNWLCFGERQRAHDLYFQHDLETWQQNGTLERLDLAFSRDQGTARYVQDLLPAASSTLTEWVQQGAAIYVCGSQAGMAAGVHQALQTLLGEATLNTLQETGRYRRDVY